MRPRSALASRPSALSIQVLTNDVKVGDVTCEHAVKGGLAGRTGSIIVNPGQADERNISGFSDGIKLKRGDLVRVVSTGGGGYGDPLERELANVENDVADGFVTVKGARDDYGVVILDDTLAVDTAATAGLRAERRAARCGALPFYDRGPQFEALEQQHAQKLAAAQDESPARSAA